MAGRFPGASDLVTFWDNLRRGVETITWFSDDELRAAGEAEARFRDPAYVKACGKLADVDKFDAAFFGISPRDASIFDPQHRLFLECAWEAFERSGYAPDRIPGRVAVFASCGAAEYLMKNLLRNAHIMDSVGAWLVRHNGNDPNFLATRVSYQLNLNGPSMNIQTACSSSLVAVHIACQALLTGECDMALAGGSTISTDQDRGYLYKEGEIYSPDGHCRAFDARSAGTLMANAVGCVVLKRLDDALRDGDNVLAVVRGSAINNDGSQKVGYLAPSVSGQARVIREALEISGVDPEDVSYIEAHGTGTLIGDPIEVTALTEAFSALTPKKQFCAIGSLKTNFGHAGEAAGICGFIKTILALRHKQIPASLHYETPNPQIDFADSPVYVNRTLADWRPPPSGRRIAGVTSLGAGGTNVHVILEEAPAPPPAVQATSHRLLTLSARTPAALERAAQNLAAHLRTHPGVPLADVAFTLLEGRKGFPCRRAVVASDATGAAVALEAADAAAARAASARRDPPPVAFLFPGGGAQYARMGVDLYEREPVYREAFDDSLSHLDPQTRTKVRDLCFADRGQARDAGERLEAPSLGLPALFATEYALARLLMSWGIVPAAVIGHSAGEYAAACLAGVMSLRDAVSIVALRGRLFETLPDGAMLSVPLSEQEAKPLLDGGLSFAAVNGPSLCVLSGPVAAIAGAEATLKARGVDSTRVHIRVAAHSSMLDPILSEFESFCRRISFAAPQIPLVSNLTGTWVNGSETMDAAYWVRHLRATVRFGDGLEALLSRGEPALVEVGPGRTLGSLARQQKTKPAVVVQSLRHPQEDANDAAFLLGAAGKLWVAGVALDAEGLCGPDRRRVELPTYPYERQRYWVDPDASQPAALHPTSVTKRPDPGEWFYGPSWARAARPATSRVEGTPCTWLVFSDGSPLVGRVVAKLRDRGDQVVEVKPGARFARADDDGSYTVPPASRSDYDALHRELRSRKLLPDRVAHFWGLGGRPSRFRLFERMARTDPLALYEEGLAQSYFSLVFLAQSFAGETDAMHIAVVSSGMQGLEGEVPAHPERALALGASKVIPREWPWVGCTSIDIAFDTAFGTRRAGRADGPAPQDIERAAEDLIEELDVDQGGGEVVLRGMSRWVRRFDPVRLPPAGGDARLGVRPDGVYLITGGLGGIGLALAEHLAEKGRPKLVLVGRTSLPPEDAQDVWIASHGPDDATSGKIARVRALRARGAEVMIEAADVTDLDAMRAVVGRVCDRYGDVDGVFHTAGVLKDEILALRAPLAESSVIDVKARGALVLDEVLERQSLDFMILFSSVSSILGLPGQADYTAANAFLDAFARARSARRPHERTVSVNFNAWKEVGMLARSVRQEQEVASSRRAGGFGAVHAGGNHPILAEIVEDTPDATVFRARLRKADTWFLAEHVVRGGGAVMPGTGLLEIARAALEHRREGRAVELRDVVFSAPFALDRGADEVARTLHVRLDRKEGRFSIYGRSPEETFASGRAAYVNADGAPSVDLAALRTRTPARAATVDNRLVQSFMDFGPRWACVRRIDVGAGEALLELELPAAFVSDLDVHPLHPALLDMATGGAQILLPGFDPKTMFLVPFSYGRLLLRRPLPVRAFSHIRARPGAKDSAVFDVAIYDEAGREVVTIEGFVMRRATGVFATVPAAVQAGAGEGSTRSAPSRPDTPLEAAIREGMTPAEGMDVIDRVLRRPFSPQIVACTVDLHAWIDRLDREARASLPSGEASAEGAAPTFARPSVSSAFVAPRDALEQDIAALWCSLLGTSEVGIHDDFFELGGQSLVAVRLFHQIDKKYGVELQLATLFQAPTVAQCAAVVREHMAASGRQVAKEESRDEGSAVEITPVVERRPQALVMLQRGADRLPFYCVHGAGGNVLNFRDISRAMDPAQPFYGLQANGIDGVTRPHETIEEMAEAYLAEVRALQPHGPYLLGGYSGGGMVAFEMARRLTDAGEKVELLAFIDTFHPQMPMRKYTLRTRAARLRSDGFRYVTGTLVRLRDEVAMARDEWLIERLLARGEPIPFDLRESHLTRTFDRAGLRYRPRPWPGRAIMYRASHVEPLYADAGPSYGWDQQVLGGVEIVLVPGNHHTLLLGTNVERLVQSLREELAAAQKRAPRREVEGLIPVAARAASTASTASTASAENIAENIAESIADGSAEGAGKAGQAGQAGKAGQPTQSVG
jgi:acyl transferase domain-containing protein/thioesterase domain-containing protein